LKLQLTNPAHERFITDQMKSGQYTSAEAVVEEILDSVINDAPNADDIAAIAEADAQIDRGECIDLADFAAEYRKPHTRRVVSF
jgi:hypothetical protein